MECKKGCGFFAYDAYLHLLLFDLFLFVEILNSMECALIVSKKLKARFPARITLPLQSYKRVLGMKYQKHQSIWKLKTQNPYTENKKDI